MAKKDNKNALVYQNSMKQALEKFDLKALKNGCKNIMLRFGEVLGMLLI